MSRRGLQLSTDSEFLRNLKALGFDQSIHCKNTKVVIDDLTFTLHPNSIKAFEIISYFLFQLLDKKKTNTLFKDVWPVIDKNRSIGYRQRAFQWLKHVQPGTALMNAPLRKSYFVDCRGEPMKKIFMAFTAHVIENQRSNNKKDIVIVNPSPLSQHQMETERNDDRDKSKKHDLRLNTAGKRSTECRPGITEDFIRKRTRTFTTSKLPDVSLVESKEGSLLKEPISANRKQSVRRQDSHKAMRERFNSERQEIIDNERIFAEYIAVRNKENHYEEKKNVFPERTQDESKSHARVEQEHRLTQRKEEEQAEKECVLTKRQERRRAEHERKEKESAEQNDTSAGFLLIRQEQKNLLAFCKQQVLKAKEIEANERRIQEAKLKESVQKETVRNQEEQKLAQKKKIQRLLDQRLGEYVTQQKEKIKELFEKDPQSLTSFLINLDTDPEMSCLSDFESLHSDPNPDSVIFRILDTPLDKVNSDTYVSEYSSTPSPSIAANTYQSSNYCPGYIERTPFIADITPGHKSMHEVAYKSTDEADYEPIVETAPEPIIRATHEEVSNTFMETSSSVNRSELQTCVLGSPHASPFKSFQGIEHSFLSESPESPPRRFSIKRNEYYALPRTLVKEPNQSPLRNSFVNRPVKGSPVRNPFVTIGRGMSMRSPAPLVHVGPIPQGSISYSGVSVIFASPERPEWQKIRGVDDDYYEFRTT